MKRVYIKNDDGHFVCPHCDEVKEKQNTMFYHMQTHEGKLPYECNICKKGFVQKQEMILHKQRKHADAEEPVAAAEKYLCPFDDCDFADIRKGNIRIHCMRKHGSKYLTEETITKSMDDGYTCLTCNYVNKSHSGILYHLSTCLLEHGVISPTSEFGTIMNAASI